MLARKAVGGKALALKVIGAGFGRTGTDSMREALNILGFGPCHHMFEVSADPEQKRRWRAMVAGAAPDWEELFEGYASCVDLPAAWYWRELIDVWPDAKVVLTWRGSESWWASFEPVAREFLVNSDDPQSLAVTLVADRIFGGRPLDRAHAVAHLRGAQRRGPGDRPRRAGCSSTTSATAGSRSAPTSACRCPTSPTRAATPPAKFAPTSTATSPPAARDAAKP